MLGSSREIISTNCSGVVLVKEKLWWIWRRMLQGKWKFDASSRGKIRDGGVIHVVVSRGAESGRPVSKAKCIRWRCPRSIGPVRCFVSASAQFSCLATLVMGGLSGTYLVLKPQERCVKVPDLPHTKAPAHSNSRGCVGVQMDWPVQSKIGAN